jgi:hypothetical protein
MDRFFNQIKQCRRIETGCDKLTANYLAFIKLASIRIWLRANESTSTRLLQFRVMLAIYGDALSIAK